MMRRVIGPTMIDRVAWIAMMTDRIVRTTMPIRSVMPVCTVIPICAVIPIVAVRRMIDRIMVDGRITTAMISAAAEQTSVK
jgi:hypothetical protein